MPTLEFVYDFVSVPCYLAWTQLDAIAAESGAEMLESNPHSPVQSLPLMRGAIVAEERGELEPYLTAIFEAVCLKARNMSDVDLVRETLDEAGLDAATYFSQIERRDVKDRLRQNTEDAVARGVFGVPTFFVGERMFFGQDRLEFVKQALH